MSDSSKRRKTMTQQPFESLGGVLARVSVRSKEARDGSARESAVVSNQGCDECGGLGWIIRGEINSTAEDMAPVRCSCWVKPLDIIRKHSNIGDLDEKNLRNMVDDSSDPLFKAACQVCADYADDPSGWLCLVGPMRSYKTSLAAGVVNRCIDAGRSTLFLHAADLADSYWHAVRSTMGQTPNGSDAASTYELARIVPVLAIDGVPSAVGDENHLEGLERVLDLRHSAQLPTLLTMQGRRTEWSPYLRGLIDDDGFPVKVVSAGAPRSEAGSVPYMLLQSMTWEGYDPSYGGAMDPSMASMNQASVDNLRRWCRELPATRQLFTIVVCGVGEGKTHLAVCAAKERMLMGDNVYYASVPDLLDRFRSTVGSSNSNESDIMREIDSVDFLVLEDVGSQRSTQYGDEKLFRVINNRYERRLPTMMTLVQDYWDELLKKERVHSRLQDPNLCQHILIAGIDYRRSRRD